MSVSRSDRDLISAPASPRINANCRTISILCRIQAFPVESKYRCHPWRALACSATRSRVARSFRTQISVVGTAIRARSSGGIRGSPKSAHQAADRFEARRAGTHAVVGDERLPSVAHLLAQTVQIAGELDAPLLRARADHAHGAVLLAERDARSPLVVLRRANGIRYGFDSRSIRILTSRTWSSGIAPLPPSKWRLS